MQKQLVKTKTKTSLAVGVALLSVAGMIAAAAAISTAVLPAKLTIKQASAITSATYVKGSTADMIGINLTASNGSVVVSSLAFNVLADDDASFATVENDLSASDHISSCSLLNSRDTLIKGPEPIDSSGLLTFDGLTIGITRGKTQSYKVSCDLANVTTTSSNDDIFALTIDKESQVNASTSSGTALTGRTLDIGNSSDAGINLNGGLVAVTVNNGGHLEASLDSTSPSSNIILGSSTDVSVGAWRFVATDEAFEINQMTFINSGDDAVANAIRVSCINVSGETEASTGYFSGRSALFSGLNCYVPEDSYSKISVSIETNVVSSIGAESGSTFQLGFSDLDFEAVGLSSGTEVSEGDFLMPEIFASDMVLYETKPTISLSSGSPAGAGIPGRNEAFRFDVMADSRGSVTVHELTFKVNSTDIADSGWNNCTTELLSKFEIYDIEDLSTSLGRFLGGGLGYLADGTSCTASSPEGVSEPIAYWQIGEYTSRDPLEIAAGETKTFAVYFDTTGASAVNNDSLGIDLPAQASVDTFSFKVIVWRGGMSDVGDGTYIRNLPVFGGTITY